MVDRDVEDRKGGGEGAGGWSIRILTTDEGWMVDRDVEDRKGVDGQLGS